MQRKTKSDLIEPSAPPGQAAAAPIKETISGVMTDAVEALTDAEPVLPDALSDRAQDHWEPLLAIAELAGGDWPRLARAAAVALANGRDDDDGSLGHRLLSDCREVFETTGAERFKTGDLIEYLVALEDAPWGDYRGKPVTGMKVAYWLKPYGIKPKHIGGFRGYQRSDFNDAWARYVRPPSKVSKVSIFNLRARLQVIPRCPKTKAWTPSGTPVYRLTKRVWTPWTPHTSKTVGGTLRR